MPKYPQSPEIAINDYLNILQKANRSRLTIKTYYHILNQSVRFLATAGLETLPHRLTEREIRHLINSYQVLDCNKAFYVNVVGAWIAHYDNLTVRKMRLVWPQNMRINADWLEPHEAAILRAADLGPYERLVIHLMLDLGLRRVEVMRLKVQDLNKGYINVHGKGRAGGKWRTVPYHPDSRPIIEAALKHRSEILAAAYGVTIPDNIIIYKKGRKVRPYSEKAGGFDYAFTQKISAALGVHFTNHTLRRTFGRSMYEALGNRDLEVIALILGHDNTQTTVQYLGLNLNHMAGAMRQFSDYYKPKLEVK